jgi:hypothetical protein
MPKHLVVACFATALSQAVSTEAWPSRHLLAPPRPTQGRRQSVNSTTASVAERGCARRALLGWSRAGAVLTAVRAPPVVPHQVRAKVLLRRQRVVGPTTQGNVLLGVRSARGRAGAGGGTRGQPSLGSAHLARRRRSNVPRRVATRLGGDPRASDGPGDHARPRRGLAARREQRDGDARWRRACGGVVARRATSALGAAPRPDCGRAHRAATGRGLPPAGR